MVVVPTLTPVTIPVLLIVATPVFDEDQVPPVVALLNVIVLPEHTVVEAPVIGAGVVLTVKALLAGVPQPVVYVMFTAPVLRPVTTPLEDTVALLVLPEVHVPNLVVSVKLLVPPKQTVAEPKIGVGTVLTFTSTVSDTVIPQFEVALNV
jgi:hypothetical protein